MKVNLMRILMAMVLLLSAGVVRAAIICSGSCGLNLTWTLNDEGVLTISGSGKMNNWDYYGSPFGGNSKIKTAIICEGVTSIEDETFSCCSSLTSVEIPESVTYIGSDAFSGCYFTEDNFVNHSSLSDSNNWCATFVDQRTEDGLIIDKNVVIKHTGKGSKVSIPSSVTKIGAHAFEDCSGLTSIVFPESVTSIGENAFYGCCGLTSIVFPESVTSIDNYAFASCSSLTSVSIQDVICIGDNAFADCTSLTFISMPNVTSIGVNAFSSCSSLTLIVIPTSVTSIGVGAFEGCYFTEDNFVNHSSLLDTDNWGARIVERRTEDGWIIDRNVLIKYSGKDPMVSIPASVISIGEYAFSDCSGLTSIKIPSSVTSIGVGAFEGCESLTSITIPVSVTSIGDYAFSGCYFTDANFVNNSSLSDLGKWGAGIVDQRTEDGLIIDKNVVITHVGTASSVSLPSSVTSIGEGAFYGCNYLTSIILSSSVTSIGERAFSRCSNLATIVLPASLRSIGDYAFSHCSNLTTIYAMMETPFSFYKYNDRYNTDYSDPSFFGRDARQCTLYVPIGCKKNYEDEDGWEHFANIIELAMVMESDIDQYDNVIYASNTETRSSTAVSIPINMKNSVIATDYSFSLVLPKQISPSMVTLKKSTERKEDEMSFSKAVQSDGSIKVVCYSTDGQPFSGNDGEVATIIFTVPAEMEVGDYPIIIKNAEISENGIAHKIPEEIISRLHIENYLPGDANMDGEVSVSDLSCIVSYLLNLDVPETFYVKAADANEDGDVSVSDLSTIVNIILYGNPNGANGAKARGERSAAECLFSAEPFTITPGEEATLSLQLSSDQEMTAFQFDAVLPDGLTCTKVRRSSIIGEEHSFRSASLEDNLTRIVCYSGSNATFSTNEGTIAKLTLKADKDMLPGLYALNLQNAEVVSLNGSAKLDGQAFAFEVVAPMGIEMLDNEYEDMPCYDLMGRRINNNNSVVYIEYGKKKVVK